MEIASKGIVFISGRLTSEMLTKLIRLGIPVVVLESTPTTATIRLAREYNITLLGYVRGERDHLFLSRGIDMLKINTNIYAY